MGTSCSRPGLPVDATHQSRATACVPEASATFALTGMAILGAGLWNVISEIAGGTMAEKLSFRRPGLPAVFSKAGIFELAQFPTSWLSPAGEIRSSEVE